MVSCCPGPSSSLLEWPPYSELGGESAAAGYDLVILPLSVDVNEHIQKELLPYEEHLIGSCS